MTWRKRILKKLNALPEPKRTQALREFEAHDYCGRREKRHNCLIDDIPHPAMAVNDDDEWIL